MKVERNDPCPCGSGKKFKKCHGAALLDREAPEVFPDVVLRWAETIAQQRREHESRFGKLRPPVHLSHAGKRFVAVGRQLIRIPEGFTFHDFLHAYVTRTVGVPWLKGEAEKPFDQRHPIAQWRASVERAPAGEDVIADAHMEAYVQLGFDLYALRHHGALQRSLIERLKRPDHFQGARHELLAAVVCVRAGLEIEYFDPRRAPSRPEFIGTHRITSSRVAVEAKSRHRRGSLGVEGPATSGGLPRADVKAILSGAFKKVTSDPLVVFLEMNLPASPAAPYEWVPEVLQSLNELNPPPGPDPYALLIVHNNPIGYCVAGDPAPQKTVVSLLSGRPKVAHDEGLLLEIKKQAEAVWDAVPPADFPTTPSPKA